MIERLVDKIISKQTEYNILSEEDLIIYRYGYILVCEVFINIIIAAIIGIISGDWIIVILFLILYIPLRSFCGGWHADKFWKCTIYSNLIIVIMLVIDEYVMNVVTDAILFILYIICLLVVFFTAPVDIKSKPISTEERKIYKNRINMILIIHMFIFCVAALYKLKKILFVIVFLYIIQVIMLIVAKVDNL